jgi:HEAT repeat protein
MFPRIPALVVLLLATASTHAQFLGRSAAQWAVELDQGDERARRNAAFALGKLGGHAADHASQLQHAVVSDKDARVREAAAFALGEIGQRSLKLGKGIADALTQALKDDNMLVRRSAVCALGCLGPEAGARRAIESALSDKAPEVRQNAAWALGRMGADAVASLGRAVGDRDTLVQRDAAGALGKIAQSDANAVRAVLPGLAALAVHSDNEVKKAALLALLPCVGPEDAKTEKVYLNIQRALLDGDEEVRRNAAFALSNIGGVKAAPAVDILLEALRNGDVDLKRQAAAGLRNIGPFAEKALPELQRALNDKDAPLRGAAAFALGGLGKGAEPAVPALVAMVTNRGEVPENRAMAASSLSFIGEVKPAIEAVPKLLDVLTDAKDNGRVRERVLWALRAHNIRLAKMTGVRDAFVRVLTEPKTEDNRMARYDCAFMTGMLYASKAPNEVYPVLLEYLKDKSIQVFRNNAVILGGSGAEATGGKTSSREVGEGDGRRLALEALQRIGPSQVSRQPEIVAALRSIADDDAVYAPFRKECRDFLRQLNP